MACKPPGNLTIEGSINNSLEEVSAIETVPNNNLLWVIEDAGNDNHLYALNKRGKIIRDITITNATNEDWEDLAMDNMGNIYIGDFGNNNKKRTDYTIYKVNREDLNRGSASAEIIQFKLPKEKKPKDFEAFFVLNKMFYLFTKTHKKLSVFSVPNTIGKHEATFLTKHKFTGKENKITAADISNDGQSILLLAHDGVWHLTNFSGTDFFSGSITKKEFRHNSQKEGICFFTKELIMITDERNGYEGGNIYSFSLN